MNIRASPVVVRCLTCAAAVDASAADTCPFCGTDVTAMPVIAPEPPTDVEPIAATPEVTALALVPRRRRRRRRWPLVLVVAAAAAAAFLGKDMRLSSRAQTRARMPSIQIPVVTEPPAATPVATPSPAPTPPASAVGETAVPARAPQGCTFFTTQEIDRQYAFARGRADLKLQRARQINEHYFALDHDKKSYDARARAAADEHATTVAHLDNSLVGARNACDASLLV